MNYKILLLCLFCNLGCFAQTPNPDLFQTWYLYDYYSTDDNIHHPVQNIAPAISPSVTFTGTDLNGTGACNGFFGTFTLPADDFLIFDNFGATLTLCGYNTHTNFEGAYFSLFQSGGQYTISGQGNNMTLRISTPIFIEYVFGNTALGLSDFNLNQITVHPNPAESNIYIDSQNNSINKIEIYNSLGQTVKTVQNSFDKIDIADFAAGVYMIKLYSDNGTATKKIIKK